MKIKLKSSAGNRIVAFNNKGGRLKNRTDLIDLAIIALESNNKGLINLFEPLPELAKVKAHKTKALIEALKNDETHTDSKKATTEPEQSTGSAENIEPESV